MCGHFQKTEEGSQLCNNNNKNCLFMQNSFSATIIIIIVYSFYLVKLSLVLGNG